MKAFSNLLVPFAVASMALAGTAGFSSPETSRIEIGVPAPPDTVKYPLGAYKLRRVGNLEEIAMADSLLKDESVDIEDTLPHISARDTIKVPDSLRLSDPFRYKYYVALVDSLTHRQVSDSLKTSFQKLFASGDSLKGLSDSLDRYRLDSIYVADSAAIAKARFDKWYASLDKKARKKYDFEKMIPIRLAQMDSLRDAKERKQEIRDSIIEETPRILETFAVPDSMQYKRIISWTVDQDFHDLDISIPDTTANHYFHDYPFMRKDVNATWLGVAGSPVQYYNFFNRTSTEGVEFYKAQEAWAYSPSTLPQFNTKTPYTELAYWGNPLTGDEEASNNIHILTTQNIIPDLNFHLMYDRWGGGGNLNNEETINKNVSVGLNYLGKKYMANAGYIWNKVSREENGGISDLSMIRDTTVNARELDTRLSGASSAIKKNTLFLDQQLRIPFEFINRIKAKKDSSFVADSLMDRNITTAFIGHSSEFSSYSRNYLASSSSDPDSLGQKRLDNRLFIRLQPWSDEAPVSKIDVGVGTYTQLFNQAADSSRVTETSFYAYAGAKGQFKKYVDWNAKGHFVFAGSDIGNMDVSANAHLKLYPFRRAKTSPVIFGASFSESLLEPNYYQKHMFTSLYRWDKDFDKASTTKIEGSLEIPRWKFDAKVGYALLSNNIYYDVNGYASQNETAMSVLSAYARKDIAIAGFLHLDNRVLFQLSSNEEVIPLPKLALNLRYYVEFLVQRDKNGRDVMRMQIGADGFFNTKWYSPAWNPETGVFYNQTENSYTNGPWFDAFVNIQWKRACIFVKYQNAGQGWPMKTNDYFSADRYIISQRSLKFGVFWPFYRQPYKNPKVNIE